MTKALYLERYSTGQSFGGAITRETWNMRSLKVVVLVKLKAALYCEEAEVNGETRFWKWDKIIIRIPEALIKWSHVKAIECVQRIAGETSTNPASFSI